MITAALTGHLLDRWTATDGAQRWTVRYQPDVEYHRWEIVTDSGLEVYPRGRQSRRIRAACRQAVRDQQILEGVEE